MRRNFVYIIKGININNKTKYYIGYTNNLYRRIRQHNREIVGGAKATNGYKWNYCGIIANIKDDIEGLRIEWRLKHSTKQTNIKNRINSFFTYINTFSKVSPKSNVLDNKLLFYLNFDLLPIKRSSHIIIINTSFTDIIIDHLMDCL